MPVMGVPRLGLVLQFFQLNEAMEGSRRMEIGEARSDIKKQTREGERFGESLRGRGRKGEKERDESKDATIKTRQEWVE
ncbi:hypothetical protein ACLOJK_012620 [Asimina triloba]